MVVEKTTGEVQHVPKGRLRFDDEVMKKEEEIVAMGIYQGRYLRVHIKEYDVIKASEA